jgi:Tfp pilus assembly protein PilV
MRKTISSPKRGGFSLVEAAVATAIIGIGVVALMTAIGSGTRTNEAGRQITQAVFLAQEIREWTRRLPFEDPQTPSAPVGLDQGESQASVDDLDDLMGVTYSPAQDAHGYPIADMTAWSQAITLTWRNASDLASVVSNGTSDIVHVQVDVSYNGVQVLSTGWLVTRKD